MRLEYMMTADVQEAKEKNLPVILPIGTIEWHGPHCALGCDTMICQGFADKIAESKECVVCPPVWYGVASYAVGGPENGTVTIDVDVYENYIYGILKSMLYGGFKNIYMLIHHQFEDENYMTITLACAKAAKKLIMEYMEDTMGKGWWGSNSFSSYYDNLGTDSDFPFGMIKVYSCMSTAAQHATGYDHAGKYESSLLKAFYPDAVKLERLPQSDAWFIQSAYEASAELGQKMIEVSMVDLLKRIK